MTNGKRDYKKELNWENTKKRSRLKDRVERHKARRMVEKETGNLPSSRQVDHIKPLTSGGSNKRGNLQVISAKANLSKEANRKKRSK